MVGIWMTSMRHGTDCPQFSLFRMRKPLLASPHGLYMILYGQHVINHVHLCFYLKDTIGIAKFVLFGGIKFSRVTPLQLVLHIQEVSTTSCITSLCTKGLTTTREGFCLAHSFMTKCPIFTTRAQL